MERKTLDARAVRSCSECDVRYYIAAQQGSYATENVASRPTGSGFETQKPSRLFFVCQKTMPKNRGVPSVQTTKPKAKKEEKKRKRKEEAR